MKVELYGGPLDGHTVVEPRGTKMIFPMVPPAVEHHFWKGFTQKNVIAPEQFKEVLYQKIDGKWQYVEAP